MSDDVLVQAEQHLVLVQLLRHPSAYLRYVQVRIGDELHQREAADLQRLSERPRLLSRYAA